MAASVTVTDPFSAAAFGKVSLSLGGTVRYSITALLTTAFVGSVTNLSRATVSGLITDTIAGKNTSATITNNVTPAALLTINKTDGVGTVVAGSTTAYTVTVANQGLANAPGSVFLDPAAIGLNCTSVTFSATLLASITVSPSP